MDEFEYLKIQLEVVTKATSNFSNTAIIGSGGFGKVYKGEVSHYKGRSMVAIKRLDRKLGQGDPQFWKEVMMLSRYTHKNLISLLGFCDENGEKILVYEYASNGSLDNHLCSTSLTWAQRIEICLDAAKGLRYLHDHKGTQQRVLHRDIKSANILLDHDWRAKVSDMGLSKLAPANQLHTLIFTDVVGTRGYCDPEYMTTYTLTKESDVYSFGVVLFEVLCGRLCYELDSNREFRVFVPTWKESCKYKKIDKIIFKDLTTPMDRTSLETYVNIAFQCVHESRKQRPKISLAVERLEIALKLQKRYEMKASNKYGDEAIIKGVETRPTHRYLEDLISHGKRFFNLGNPSRTIKQSEQPLKPPLPNSTPTSETSPSTETERNKLVFLNAGIYSFDLGDLLKASAEVLGKGSVGTSYKAVMEDSTTVVVKQLKDVVVQKEKFESIMEILGILGQLNNEHLNPLRAFYYSKYESFLVYDYMPAGNLSTRLHGTNDGERTPLDWDQRIRIASSAARGVMFLHEVGKLVHGNIKSSNILLKSEDEKYALVSDFGLNTLFRENFQVLGNSAPEVLNDQKLTFESDVYNFGVLLLELLTGKDPNRTLLDGDHDLPRWVQGKIREECEADVFDVELIRHSNTQPHMIMLLHIAIECISTLPNQRPSMNEVVKKIEDINQGEFDDTSIDH